MGGIIVLDKTGRKYVIVSAEQLDNKSVEPTMSGKTMHEYLMTLIDSLGLEWHGLNYCPSSCETDNSICGLLGTKECPIGAKCPKPESSGESDVQHDLV